MGRACTLDMLDNLPTAFHLGGMPRAPRILSDKFPYHLTARSNNQEWFHLPLSQVWDIMQWQLADSALKYATEIIAFVLMANHFHLLAQTPLGNVSEFMNHFMRETSKHIGRASNRKNHVFGSRFFSCVIYDPAYFANVYRYVYQNPLRKGLVTRVEDYPFSTLPALLENRALPFPLFDLETVNSQRVPKDLEERVVWLNEPQTQTQQELIRNGLRRKEFAFTRSKTFKREVEKLLNV